MPRDSVAPPPPRDPSLKVDHSRLNSLVGSSLHQAAMQLGGPAGRMARGSTGASDGEWDRARAVRARLFRTDAVDQLIARGELHLLPAVICPSHLASQAGFLLVIGRLGQLLPFCSV